ncbi:OstA family protein [Phormidium sp. CLA17]|uniref:LptA/OstA family protein n=1 Tax=Leptolyngbya sp. Cla-17 TaxID=2803751 RepID=UPI001492F0E4|nr:LptA/OstA family protein [Leptolyngbya sp. Cla-17]MBM0742092.1 OstA family protein [Leptolyngbya sp. Cla-17]
MRHSQLLRVPFRNLALFAIAPATIAAALLLDGLIGFTPVGSQAVNAQTGQSDPARPLTLRSDIQEANSKTGVITARGNVQIYYPSRQIQATAAQAQYYSRERRIILTGDVYVLQKGNSLRGETITYLIDEGRFVALPQSPRQVEAIYLVQDSPAQAPAPVATPTPAPTADPFGQSEFTPSTPPGEAIPAVPTPSR